MEFFEIKKHLRKVKDDYFVIGTRPLDPLAIIDGKHLIIDKISIKNLGDVSSGTGTENQVLTSTTSGVMWKSSSSIGGTSTVTHWEEAFEEDSNGEITPTDSEYISDTMWILNNDGGESNLELRANHWRYNTGPEAFTEDISF